MLFIKYSFLPCLLGLVYGNYVMNEKGITWETSCSEERQKEIKAAWAGALELGDSAANRFITYTRPIVEQGQLNEVAQHHINQHDPGYVQMFALDWSPEGVEKITHVLSNFKQKANADPGTNGRGVEAQSKIAISCPQNGEKDCEEGDIAVTINNQNDGQWTGSTIDFCPDFFDLDKFADLKSAAERPVVDGKNGDELQHKVRTLFLDDEYPGTDANRVFHEMTHLWWIGPTNWDVARGLAREEEYGFMECADLAANGGCVMFDNPDVVWNADHYSWYAEYGYWVEKGFDSWHEKDRPVKLYIKPE